MTTYNSLKEDILQINKDISGLFPDARSITGASDHTFTDWQKTCDAVKSQMSGEIIRVAVVGPIKSGKSTFINSLFKGEYLKRGAGVVTSIVTRVRNGKKLKATLLFKSWDEINSDMEQALVLFPPLEWRNENYRFDIRQKKERMDLQKALISLNSEHLISNGARNVNNILLTSYLKGYEKIKDLISLETQTSQYENELFSEHWTFVGDGSMAVYLKDIQLEIDSGNIDSNIEIADCQGSDSPNPLHLAMIQDYLLLTHLIVYVVSSRTGLREADIKFLSIIKKMGIIDNILFVINCDFSEHESINDLKFLIENVKEELALIKPSPEIYSLSALFNLFKAQRANPSQKDRLRLEQWEKEPELTAFSDSETARFESSFYNRLTQGSYSLLLKNHLERLRIISSGMERWIYFNQNMLTRDAHSANEIVEKIKKHQEGMRHIKSVIKNTLTGSTKKINQDLKTDIERFFDIRYGDLLQDIIEFIRDYKVSYQQYEENLQASGFPNTLYLVFQEFKQALDTYMTETINPEVIRFIREKEKRIHENLESIADPFDAMVQDAIVGYNGMMENFGIVRSFESPERIDLPDIDTIKAITGLTLPPAVAYMRYTAKIKTEAFMRLGFYTVVKFFKKLLKKPIERKNEEGILALQAGVLRMKRETERSMAFFFKDYQENIKFQYMYKIVEAVSNSLYASLIDRFQAYAADLSNTVELINDTLIDKEQASTTLQEMAVTAGKIEEKINTVCENIRTFAWDDV
ncbi:MAG TPA: dynamin family protein [Desulfobacterales bacterium]|nr:dynamin family protein [Desulfobacterales bacterium]